MDRLVRPLLTALILTVVSGTGPADAGRTPLVLTAPAPPIATATPCPEALRSVATPTPAARSTADGGVRGDDHDGIIFTGAPAEDLANWVLFDGWDELWTPTATDVAALEAAIKAFLCASPEAQPAPWETKLALWERLPNYNRQYVGVVVDGRRLLLANFFCTDLFDDWRRTPVVVLDGGDCFFHLTYDVASGTYDHLMINGEA